MINITVLLNVLLRLFSVESIAIYRLEYWDNASCPLINGLTTEPLSFWTVNRWCTATGTLRSMNKNKNVGSMWEKK